MNTRQVRIRVAFYSMLLAMVAVLQSRVLGQGTFQNLDFENGVFITISGDPYNRVQFAEAVPGWTGYLGTNQIDRLLHNDLFLSLAGVAIWGPDNPSAGYLHGHFYMILQNSFPTPTEVPAIAQTGTIPVGSQSLRLLSNSTLSLGIRAFFGGNEIPLQRIGTASNGRPLWGGAVSLFAGQSGELRFRGEGYLDFIQFSNSPIPEPGTMAWLGLGGVAWLLRRRKQLRRGFREKATD